MADRLELRTAVTKVVRLVVRRVEWKVACLVDKLVVMTVVL